MKTLVFCFFYQLNFLQLYAQSATDPIVPFGLLSAYDRDNNNLLSFRINPASNVATKRIHFLLYGEKRYSLNELPFVLSAIYVPVHQWSMVLDYSRLGNYQINQSELNLSIGSALHPKIDFGMAFTAFAFQVNKEKWRPSFGYKVGVIFRCNEQLRIGMSFCEKRKATSFYGEIPYVEMSAGFGYAFSKSTTGTLQICRSMQGKPEVTGGLALKVKSKIKIESGYSSSGESFFLGASFQFKPMVIGCYLSNHPFLGISPAMLLKFP